MMRFRFRAAIALTATLTVNAPCLVSQPPGAAGGRKRVDELSIELKIARQKVLTQESLLVSTVLQNRGQGVIAAPDASGPSPFVYELKPLQGGQGIRTVSEQLATEATTRGTPQPLGGISLNIGPGNSVARQDDLAAMAVKPFAPGAYAVTVQTRMPAPAGPSNPAPVRILAPQPLAASFAADGALDRRMAFIDASDEPGVLPVLYLHGSLKTAEASVFRRPFVPGLPASGVPKPDSIAVSVPTGADSTADWVAWTAAGSLFAAADWTYSRTPRIARVQLGSPNARLLQPGFGLGDGSTIFLVHDGRTLSAYRISAENQAARIWTANVALPNLDRVKVRYAGGAKGMGTVQIVAIGGDANQPLIQAQSWNLADGKEALGLTNLAQLRAPVAAWSLPVSGKGKSARVDICVGPVTGKYALLAYQLEGNAKADAKAREVPQLASETPVEWALAPAGSSGNVMIAVRTGQRNLYGLSLSPAGGAAWRRLTENINSSEGVAGLDVYANADRAWVQWLDPAFGFRRASFQ